MRTDRLPSSPAAPVGTTTVVLTVSPALAPEVRRGQSSLERNRGLPHSELGRQRSLKGARQKEREQRVERQEGKKRGGGRGVCVDVLG